MPKKHFSTKLSVELDVEGEDVQDVLSDILTMLSYSVNSSHRRVIGLSHIIVKDMLQSSAPEACSLKPPPYEAPVHNDADIPY